MKRRMGLLLALLLTLSGCGSTAVPSAPAAEDVLPAEAPAENTGLTSTLLEAEPRPLTGEEILSAYFRAEEAYGWFERTPLPDSGESVRLEGAVYRRVDAPGMANLEDLRTYLRGLFSAELTDCLLAAGDACPLYRDIDGALYVSFRGRDRNPERGETLVEVVQTDSRTYSVDVSVELLEGESGAVVGLECWSLPFAYVDGRWVFTDFRLDG